MLLISVHKTSHYTVLQQHLKALAGLKWFLQIILEQNYDVSES